MIDADFGSGSGRSEVAKGIALRDDADEVIAVDDLHTRARVVHRWR